MWGNEAEAQKKAQLLGEVLANRIERTKASCPNLNLARRLRLFVVRQQPCLPRCVESKSSQPTSSASASIYPIEKCLRKELHHSHKMADPLSMTASITAIVRMAYSLCSNICQTIDSIRGAPSQIRDLSNDIRSLYSILGTLKGYLDDEETATGVIHPATSADLEAVLSNCIVIFKDLNAKVNGFQGTSGPGDVALWRRLQWNWKEKGVVALRAQLANHTRTLQIAISVANL